MVLTQLNKYIAAHQEFTFDKPDELIAYMTNSKPFDKKFSILIFLCNEKKNFEKDCVINVPILPNKSYFQDFKQLVMVELENLIFE